MDEIGRATAYTSFQDPDFVPLFSIEVPEDQQQEVFETCGENQQCIFDLIVTGDVSFAAQTSSFQEETNTINANAGKC